MITAEAKERHSHFSYERVEQVFKKVCNQMRANDVTIDELRLALVTLKLTLGDGRTTQGCCMGLVPSCCEKLAENVVKHVERDTHESGYHDRWHWLQREVTIAVHVSLEGRVRSLHDVIPTPRVSSVEAFVGEPRTADVIDHKNPRHAAGVASVIDEERPNE